MLRPTEKAYIRALRALDRRDYIQADREFDLARPQFNDDTEFKMLAETTKTLLRTREQLNTIDLDDLEIEVEA